VVKADGLAAQGVCLAANLKEAGSVVSEMLIGSRGGSARRSLWCWKSVWKANEISFSFLSDGGTPLRRFGPRKIHNASAEGALAPNTAAWAAVMSSIPADLDPKMRSGSQHLVRPCDRPA